VGDYFADLLVEDAVIVELKAVASLDAAHEAQLLHYLKATGIEVGLLLNFGRSSVQVKRMARTPKGNQPTSNQRRSALISG
jgi:GxxExxY protein